MQLDAQEKILASDTLVLQTLRNLRGVPTAPVQSAEAGSPQPMSKEERDRLRESQNRLEVARIAHTPLIEIRFANPDPQYSARFVNGLVQAYIEQNFNTRYQSAQQVSTFLAKELADLKVKVETSQAHLARFQKEVGIIGTDDKQNIVMRSEEHTSELQSHLNLVC